MLCELIPACSTKRRSFLIHCYTFKYNMLRFLLSLNSNYFHNKLKNNLFSNYSRLNYKLIEKHFSKSNHNKLYFLPSFLYFKYYNKLVFAQNSQIVKKNNTLCDKALFIVNLFLRAFYLGFQLFKIVFLKFYYSFKCTYISKNPNENINQYNKTVLNFFSNNGIVVLKLGQWLSSRVDLVSTLFSIHNINSGTNNINNDLIIKLSKLTDSVAPHKYEYTASVLEQTFGKNYNTFISISDENNVLGSGCIAQVYHGILKKNYFKYLSQNSSNSNLYINTNATNKNSENIEVAIKVLHPNIQEKIEIDITIIDYFVKFISLFSGFSKYLNMYDSYQSFKSLIKHQTNLITEANNILSLKTIYKNLSFLNFPIPYIASNNILIESYIPHIKLSKLLLDDSYKKKYGKNICNQLTNIFVSMVYNNYIHGDLHSGNIIVQLLPRQQTKLSIVDCGIVLKLSNQNYNNFFDMLMLLLNEKKKKNCGKLLIERSKNPNSCINKEEYIQHVAELFSNKKVNFGQILTKMCYLANKYHVELESEFTNLLANMIIIEGLVASLNSDYYIFNPRNYFYYNTKFFFRFIWEKVSHMVKLEKSY